MDDLHKPGPSSKKREVLKAVNVYYYLQKRCTSLSELLGKLIDGSHSFWIVTAGFRKYNSRKLKLNDSRNMVAIPCESPSF